jgi:hypothetical protein
MPVVVRLRIEKVGFVDAALVDDEGASRSVVAQHETIDVPGNVIADDLHLTTFEIEVGELREVAALIGGEEDALVIAAELAFLVSGNR